MAAIPISTLPAGSVPADADILPMVQSGVTNKVTKLQMFTNPNIPATSSSSIGVINQNGTRYLHSYGASNSIYSGASSGNFTLTGARNSCFGTSTLAAATSASDSVVAGWTAGQSITSGQGNCIWGSTSGQLLTTGSYNVAAGYSSYTAGLTGSYNLCLGANSGLSYTGAESSNLLLMNSGTLGESNIGRIGTTGNGVGQITDLYLAGNVYIGGSSGTLIQDNGFVVLANGMQFKNNGYTMSGNNPGDTYFLGAYDTNDFDIDSFIVFTSGTTPTCDINTTTLSVSGLTTLSGGEIHKVTSVTASTYTALTTDYILACNRSGAIALTLISSPATGRTYRIKDISGAAVTNNITITPAAGTIDGAVNFVINTNYGSVDVMYNGTSWSIL